jgi:hypothetical protein
MALSPGARLGAYEITALIGTGGMGEVFVLSPPRLLFNQGPIGSKN